MRVISGMKSVPNVSLSSLAFCNQHSLSWSVFGVLMLSSKQTLEHIRRQKPTETKKSHCWFRIKVRLVSLNGKSYSCSIYILDRVASKWMSHVVIPHLHQLKSREMVEIAVQVKLDASQAKLHRFVRGEFWRWELWTNSVQFEQDQGKLTMKYVALIALVWTSHLTGDS